MNHPTLFNMSSIEGGAIFSPCRTWRYALWRLWDFGESPNWVAFIGLNPSTADETVDDPTIRRCIRFAKAWGYGGVYMLNAFAYRATQPRDMKKAVDPVGPENDAAIAKHIQRCSLVVAAWGNHGSFLGRSDAIKANVRRRMECLAVNKKGEPKHPLWVKKDRTTQLWWEPGT